MKSATSIPPACNRFIISDEGPVRLCGQQVRTLLYLLGSDRELDTLASLELGLDEGTNVVEGEEHHDSKDETVEEVEGGVSQLFTDGVDAHLGNGSGLLEGINAEPIATAGLGPFAGRADDGILKASVRSTP